MKLDQQSWRRYGRTGLTGSDESQACPGYLCYAPHHGDGEVLVIDINGEEVHRWKMPYSPGSWGYILPNGNLFYLGKAPSDGIERFPAFNNFNGGLLLEADWDGNIIWQHEDTSHHHDARRTDSGGAIYLTVEPMPPELAKNVKGGIPGSEITDMWADKLVEVDASGQSIWEWHSYEHLDVTTDIITPGEPRHEWSHGNTIVPLEGDRVLVSFRNISSVLIIDKKSGEITWKVGWDIIARQHDPSLLDNGNILIFDNGERRQNDVRVFSRVIEINPANNEIVWEYSDHPYYNFYSPRISGARRLPNGNTLITEGMFGRMFQVTPSKEVVWEYINPYWDQGGDGAENNGVFRSTWYLPGQIPKLP